MTALTRATVPAALADQIAAHLANVHKVHVNYNTEEGES